MDKEGILRAGVLRYSDSAKCGCQSWAEEECILEDGLLETPRNESAIKKDEDEDKKPGSNCVLFHFMLFFSAG
jgi:hypothetical protein